MPNFNKGDLISAEEINALKAEVKAEMLRRKLTGSLSNYGGSAYDFSDVPIKDMPIREEHYSKIRGPMAAINDSDLPPQTVSGMPSLTSLDARLTLNKSQTGKSSTSHGCQASCSGLCYNSCTSCSGCTGCSGCGGCGGCSGCGTACSTNCTSCTGGCSGCGTACSTGCTSCSGGCQNACGIGCAKLCS